MTLPALILHKFAGMMFARTWYGWPGALLLSLVLAGCGPGGGNNLAVSTPYGGVVKVPAGTTLTKPTLLSRAENLLFPSAYALTGMEVVGAGVDVTLTAIDVNGEPYGPVLAQTSTDADGRFELSLPSWDLYNPAHPWVVFVGDAAGGTRMRRFVDDLGPDEVDRSIDPSSEAAVRLLLEDPGRTALSRITPADLHELNTLVATASTSVGAVTIPNVVNLALQAAMANEAVQRKLVEITSTAANVRPLARAGIDFRTDTGEALRLLANVEDPDDNLFLFQWSVDLAPTASSINRTPPPGRELLFLGDVDGSYRLKLVVTDEKGASSPPDFATIIATTAPAQLTVNDAQDTEGSMTANRVLLIYTTPTRDPTTNSNYTNVEVQQINDSGPLLSPVTLYPPGATRDSHVANTVELNPEIAANGAMAVFSTDMVRNAPGQGGSSFDVVAFPFGPQAPVWVTDDAFHDIRPDVECLSTVECTVIYLTDEGGGSNIIATTLRDSGTGFAVIRRQPLTVGQTSVYSPRLSQDGQWVVYASRDQLEGDLELYRIRADGSTTVPEPLTSNSVDDDQPEPDGTAATVVFTRNHQIWLLKTDGSGETLLSDIQLFAKNPSISANGTMVAFLAETTWGTDLFSVRSDGTFLTELTTEGSVSQPRVSSDGVRILFRSARDGDHDFYLR